MSTIDNSKTITKDVQASITPAVAIDLLKAGNERFVGKNTIDRDLNGQVSDTATGQAPFAVVLGCIDSRVPGEMVFDQGIGDIFNIRIAGNFINTDILGSMEFGCKAAGSKVIVVLGHKSCGAVKGACDGVELGNLTSMLANIQPAIDAVTDITEERNSGNAAFVQAVSDNNVALAVENIRKHSAVLKEMEDNGEIAIVGAMYDIADGSVAWY
jgi:carbonic anhydrase